MKTLFSKPYFILLTTALLLPVSAFALTLDKDTTFKTIICYLVDLLKLVIPILTALALVLFFWGVSKFILRSSGNEKDLQVGKKYMFWGILGLFVMFSFRSIIGIVTNEFEFGKATLFPFLPTGPNGEINQNACGTVFIGAATVHFGGEAPSPEGN